MSPLTASPTLTTHLLGSTAPAAPRALSKSTLYLTRRASSVLVETSGYTKLRNGVKSRLPRISDRLLFNPVAENSWNSGPLIRLEKGRHDNEVSYDSGMATALTISSATMAGTIACGCPTDVDGDGLVGFSDLLVVLSDWGCMNCDSDLDGDGETGFNDLLLVISNWDCGMTETPITGVVTNSITGMPIVGAMVDIGPCPVVTDDGGAYSIALPPGLYDVTFAASNYTAEEVQTVLFPGTPATLNADLDPIESVIVTVVLSGDQSMNGEVFADAEVEIFDGSTIIEYAWTQTGATPAAIAGEDTDMVVLGLADRQTYREQLMHVLSEPPITADQLPENVPLPPGEFPGGLQDRFEVVGMSPFSLEEAALLTLDVEVTTTSGVYADDAEVHTALPWKPAAGIRMFRWPPCSSTARISLPTTGA